jgi:hypothetical protein
LSASRAGNIDLAGFELYSSTTSGVTVNVGYRYTSNVHDIGAYYQNVTPAVGPTQGQSIDFPLAVGTNTFTFAPIDGAHDASLLGPDAGINLFFTSGGSFNPSASAPSDLTVFGPPDSSGTFAAPVAGTLVQDYGAIDTGGSVPYDGATSFEIGDKIVTVTALSLTGTPSGTITLTVISVPEPSSIVAIFGLCGMGLVGFAVRRRLVANAGRLASVAAILLAVLVLGPSFASASVVTITSGDAGGGVVLHPADVVDAVDIFAQQGNNNVVQGVTFTSEANTPNVVDNLSSAPGGGMGMVNGGFTDGPVASFSATGPGTNNTNLLNVLQSIDYGQQHVVISGLTPGGYYNVQLLMSDSTYNERIQDIAVNGTPGDTVDVMTSESYDASYNVSANSLGKITVDVTPDALSGDQNPVLSGLIVQAVPEPGSVVALVGLCGMGLVGLLLRRRKAA